MEIIQDFIPPGRRNRPGLKLDGPRWITVHDTANPGRGADALAHARYIKSDAAASRPASWHFTVDDRRIIQHLPLDEVAWHAGDGGSGQGNRQSIAIEICENADGDRTLAEAKAAQLVAYLCGRFGLGVEAVVQHNRWSGKNCPRVLRSRSGGWEGFLDAVRRHLGGDLTPILGPASAAVDQARAWALGQKATEDFVSLAPLYWELALQRGGVDPAVAYAQAAHETGFGRFGGLVRPEFHNPCGLKTKSASGNRPEDYQRFRDWREGVTAHLDHLALYAGAPGYPRADTPDPRHFPWLAGQVKTVESLGGVWAPSPDYGRRIVAEYLRPMQAAEPEPAQDQRFSDVPAGHWAAAAIRNAVDAGLLQGYPDGTFRPDQPVTRAELAVVLQRLKQEAPG